MSKLKSVFLWIPLLVLAGAPQNQDLPAAPTPAEQADAEKLVKEVFKADYAKRAPADRQALAKQLLSQGLQTKDDPKVQFLLFREARDISAQAGDPATALGAVDELSKRFSVDAFGMKSAVMAQAAKAAHTVDECKALVGVSFKLIDSALVSDDSDSAEKWAAAALQYSKRAQDLSLVARVTARTREIADQKARHEKVRKAQETLAIDPEDPAANLVFGQFLCVAKGDWDRGLPMLAKSLDAILAPLAQKEIGNPAEPAAQLSVGDAWWDLSEKEASPAKERLKEHAGIWYTRASAMLSGLNKTKIEKRLSECRVSGLLKGSWIDVTDPKLFNQPGKPGDAVEISGKPGQVTTLKMQVPKGDFDGVSARVILDPAKTCTALLIYEGPNSFAALIDVERAFFANVKGVGNGWNLEYTDWWTKEPETVLTVLLGGGEYVLYVNGKEKTRAKTARTRIEAVGLEGRNAPVKFDQIKLRRAD